MSRTERDDLARFVSGAVGDVATTRVEGEIDLSNAHDFVAALASAVTRDGSGLVVDLGSAAYIDSAGIRGLFDVRAELAQRRQAMALALPSGSPLRSVLELTGVPEAIPIHDTLDAAVSDVRARVRGPRRS